ncbi:MAG: extracellular solute-binding protein [Propionicimonas sp.]
MNDDLRPRRLRRAPAIRGAAASLASLAVILSGCSSTAPNTPATDALGPDFETTIKVMEYAGTEQFQAVDELVKELLAKEYPKVTLDFEYIDPETLSQRITTAVAGENPPDIVAYFPGPDFLKLARSGALVSLTPAIEASEEMQRIADMWAATVPPDQYMYRGDTFGFTVDLGPLSVWSWQDQLTAAGVAGPPTTIDELIAAARAVRAAGGQPMAVGMSTETIWEIDYTFNALVANFDQEGQESIARRADRGALSYSEPGFRQAVELFKHLYDEGVFNDAVLEQNYQTDAKNDWSSKAVAMFWPSGPWMVQTSPDDTVPDINVASWPTISGDVAVLSGADKVFAGLQVTDRQKEAAHQQLIAEIARIYLSPEVQAEYYRQGLMPVDVSVAEGGAASDDPWQVVLDKQIAMVASADRVVDYATYTPEIYSAITEGIQSLLLGNSTVDKVIDGMVEAQKTAYECAPDCE